MEKFIIDEAVEELGSVNDMMRWAVSHFNGAGLFYGHGTDNAWDEAVQLILPTLNLTPVLSEEIRAARLTRSERRQVAELVARRVVERIPAPYLTNKAWFCDIEFYVDERVIVPRSPIGELIGKATYSAVVESLGKQNGFFLPGTRRFADPLSALPKPAGHLRLALLHLDPTPGEIAANRAQIEAGIREAASTTVIKPTKAKVDA